MATKYSPHVWLLLMAIGLWIAFTKTSVETDLSYFLPNNEGVQYRQLLDALREGQGSRLILVALTGGDADTRVTTSKKFQQQLAETGSFSRVSNGLDDISIAVVDWVYAHRFLLSPTISSTRFTSAVLRQELTLRLDELRSAISPFDKRWLPSDPTAEALNVFRRWTLDHAPEKYQGVWTSGDGSMALLLVETKKSGFDAAQQQKIISQIRSIFNDIKDDNIELHLTGSAVFSAESRNTIRDEIKWMTTTASFLVILIILAVYRSFRLLILSMLPLCTAIVSAVAITSILFGSLHGITLAFGITLLGITIDYPIHLFSHIRHKKGAMRSLLKVWPTLRLGVITSSVGYLAMVVSDVSGLTQIGCFAITGILSAALFTRWVLPGLSDTISGLRTINQPRFLTIQFSPIYLIPVLLLLVLYAVVFPPKWEDDLAALSPIPSASIEYDKKIRGELGAPDVNHVIVFEAESAEAALQSSELLIPHLQAYTDQGGISGFDLAARYIPSIKSQKKNQNLLPNREELEAAMYEALEGFPFRKDIFKQFFDDIDNARTVTPVRVEDLSNTGLDYRVMPLLFPQNNGWTAIVTLAGVKDGHDLEKMLSGIAKFDGTYLNIKKEIEILVNQFRESALKRIAFGLLLIILLLGFSLKSFKRGLFVLIPIATAITFELMIFSIAGIQLSLFHLVSMLLVIGVGMDYSLFFNRHDSGEMQWRTHHAIGVCVTSTLVVFGILALSDLPVLKAIGQTVALGVLACYIFARLFAPSHATDNSTLSEEMSHS
jgi:predicted exporter